MERSKVNCPAHFYAEVLGEDRVRRIRQIAKANRFDLTSRERERAEQLLFDEIGASIDTAVTFAEGMHALRQRRAINLSEFAHRKRSVT